MIVLTVCDRSGVTRDNRTLPKCARGRYDRQSGGAHCETQEPSPGKFHLGLPFASLFDHLVGEREQLVRHGEAERLRGLEIDRHLELHRRLRWEIGRIGSFQDAINVGG
jgi:hypothetical protein